MIEYSLNIMNIHRIGKSGIMNGFTRKRSTQRLKHTGNLFKKNPQMKDVYKFYKF